MQERLAVDLLLQSEKIFTCIWWCLHYITYLEFVVYLNYLATYIPFGSIVFLLTQKLCPFLIWLLYSKRHVWSENIVTKVSLALRLNLNQGLYQGHPQSSDKKVSAGKLLIPSFLPVSDPPSNRSRKQPSVITLCFSDTIGLSFY